MKPRKRLLNKSLGLLDQEKQPWSPFGRVFWLRMSVRTVERRIHSFTETFPALRKQAQWSVFCRQDENFVNFRKIFSGWIGSRPFFVGQRSSAGWKKTDFGSSNTWLNSTIRFGHNPGYRWQEIGQFYFLQKEPEKVVVGIFIKKLSTKTTLLSTKNYFLKTFTNLHLIVLFDHLKTDECLRLEWNEAIHSTYTNIA